MQLRAAHPLHSRPHMLKKILFASIAALAVSTSAAGCSSKKSGDCNAVFDHIRSLTPEGMREMLDASKDAAIEKCKTLSEASRSCALAAKTMEELQKCPKD